MTKSNEGVEGVDWKLSRAQVYELIDGERSYQQQLGPGRTDGRWHRVEGYLVMLDTYLERAKRSWTEAAGDLQALDNIRKIAGIAVQCMERYGAPPRGGL